jgi:MFS family permease
LGVAVVGQALIGIGCAPVFMGTLVVLARWYPPGRFATLGSLVLAGGNAGTLLGTTPLAVAAQTLGWRGAFLPSRCWSCWRPPSCWRWCATPRPTRRGARGARTTGSTKPCAT